MDDLIFSYKADGALNKKYDVDMMAQFPLLSFYMLNPNGELWVRRGDGMKDGWLINTEPKVIAHGLPYGRKSDKLKADMLKKGYVRTTKFTPIKDEFEF